MATEIHHIWSLIHDDIIDQDLVRKGGPTVHVEYAQRAMAEFGYTSSSAERYGSSIALLAGDGGAGLVFVCLSDLFRDPEINPEVAQVLILRYADTYIPAAIEGQALDLQFEGQDVTTLTEDDLLLVSTKKTGTFFALGGFSGSLIGINKPEPDHPLVQLMTKFTTNSGMVLQLTDDLLNIVGDEAQLGKPVGSDFVLGKKTIPIVHAFAHANASEREILLSCFGKPSDDSHLKEALGLIDKLGGIEYTRNLVLQYVNEASEIARELPQLEFVDILTSWIKWISTRLH